ncbi:hypothetical protein PFICI_01801 [Pestalotiopsis fici W106-1]|uniref:Uncharacterized protein n=1 Tax=Pestalotiopsis fici (strain W106-1 / CGMCC3.15140) TaxID=1229662 RepID=W3XPI5_PESFW|nr:uncharacterized protein PFICI_01801 [Pestalotiopsis fici W106-1]ETS87973.1 hypothetical protein PFICI_01801 [Pestalotiopsis fici W106-1]
MKSTIMNLAFAASIAAAQPHNHGHGHFHQKKGTPVEKRDADVVTTVVPATMTAYILGDQEVSADEAKAGIENGLYVVVGETTPTYTPEVVSSTLKVDAAFFQKTSASSSSTSTSSSSSSSTSTSTSSAVTSTYAAATTTKSSSSSTATGVTADFPDGELDCSTFPSDYGAVAVDWLGTAGWSSIQQVPGFDFSLDSVISYIVAGVSGDSCTEGSFCSYACPDGYVKSQWPTAQGSTGQSVGGLYCNSDGKLQLTRSEYSTLCQPGCGGVSIVNNLSSDGAAVCRTDYPGSESMVIPLWTEPGNTYTLTNIESSSYYVWQGSSTTLQYYINPKGVALEDACVWDSTTNPDSAGNWAPINVGVGKNSAGMTYLSIFNNSPTSTATLDFDVVISGDISGECYYKSGSYPDGDTGCTVAISDGGSATITFEDSS